MNEDRLENDLRNHWHPILVHSATCAGLIDERRRYRSEALEEMHRSHRRRKHVVTLAVSSLAVADGLENLGNKEQLLNVLGLGEETLDFNRQRLSQELHSQVQRLLDNGAFTTNEAQTLVHVHSDTSLDTIGSERTQQRPANGDDEAAALADFIRRQEQAMLLGDQPSEQLSEQDDEQADDAINNQQATEAASRRDTSSGSGTHDAAISDLPLHQHRPVNPPSDLPATPRADALVQSTAGQTLRESYDQARLAANTRALNKKRPQSPANGSNRKVWSIEEENALLEGLEYMRGPHWRDILSLYGEQGTRSEVLKNRTQVQLKDKARNLKLYYKKNGFEVPKVLEKVTGDVKQPKMRITESDISIAAAEPTVQAAPAPTATMSDTRYDGTYVDDQISRVDDPQEPEAPNQGGFDELAAPIAT